MTPHDYDYLRRLLKTRSGLVLSSEKHYLVESRLLPVARRAGLFNLTSLVAKLHGPDSESLIVEVVEVEFEVRFAERGPNAPRERFVEADDGNFYQSPNKEELIVDHTEVSVQINPQLAFVVR